MANKNQTIFRVPSSGGAVSEVTREEAVKDCTANEMFDASTVEGLLDDNDTAFSDDFYYSADRANLAKWEKAEVAAETPAVKNGKKSASGALPLDELKAQYPDEIKDEYPSKKEAEHAFMLGDETALSRIATNGKAKAEAAPTGSGWFQMKANDPFSITEITEDAMVEAIGDRYTEKTRKKFIKDGTIILASADDKLAFGKDRDALVADYEKRQTEADKAKAESSAPAETNGESKGPGPADPKLVPGDPVRNTVTKIAGVVVERKGDRYVAISKTKGGTKLVDLTGNWVHDKTAEGGGLEKVKITDKKEAVVKAEPKEIELPPMTDKEQARLAKLESAIDKAKDALDSAPMVMGAALDEVRQKKLFRETKKADGEVCKTFGEYAEFRFGITREYAQNIAQISGYLDVANEAIEGGEKLNVSVATANALLRDTNKTAKALGLGRVEFEAMKPIITNSVALLIDIAPKDEAGQPVITPRLVDAFNEKLRDHIHDGVVEIEGKQMTIAAAKDKGLLNESLREEVITAAAEGIRVNSATIMSETREAWDRQNAPVTNGGDTGPKATEYFKGTPPTLAIDCDKHGTTKVIAVGNGRFQTKCLCRWHIDAESGDLVCFEVKGKRVKRS